MILYLLAAIGMLTVAVILWRAFGSDRVGVAARPTTIAPDDDPEFLRKLGEQHRKSRGEDEGER